MFNHSQTNPLARRNSTRALAISATAVLAILAAGTFAVSAQTPAKQQNEQLAQISAPAAVEQPGANSAPVSQQRRQVRVIPLFNTPQNQTGFEGK